MSEVQIKINQIYSDFDFGTFSFHVLDDKAAHAELNKLVDVSAVLKAIRNIFKLDVGDLFFSDIDVGANLRKFLFEQMDIITEDLIKKTLKHAIEKHEPRVSVVSISIKSHPDASANTLGNKYIITVVFNIKVLQKQITTDLVLERVR